MKQLKVQLSFKMCVWNTVLICFALKKLKHHEMNNYSDAFSCILIGSVVMLLRESHAWFRVGYVNTRPIERKLKSQPSTQQ